MDSEMLADALRQRGLKEDTVQKCIREDFDEESFFFLTPETLKPLGFSGAEIVKIMHLISKNPHGFLNDAISVHTSVVPPSNNSKNPHGFLNDAISVHTSEVLPPSNKKPSVHPPEMVPEGFSNEKLSINSDESYSDGEDAKLDPIEEAALRKYLTEDDLAERSNYDKSVMYQQLRVWEDFKEKQKDAQIIAAFKPKFVTDSEKRQRDSQNLLKRKAKTAFEEQSTSQSLPSSSRASDPSTSKEDAPFRVLRARKNTGSSQHFSSRERGSQPSTSRGPGSPQPSTSKQPGSPSTFSEPDSPLGANLQEHNSNSIAKPSINWRDRELPEYDVGSLLTQRLPKESRGLAVINNLSNKKSLERKDRKLVVRVLTKWMYHNLVSDPKQVTTDMKDGLAKSIFKAYPESFSLTESTDENLPPWEPLFNRVTNTGWIVNAARPIQEKNRQRKSKKELADDNLTKSSSNLTNAQVEAMALIVPVDKAAVKAEIMQGMARSFDLRQDERKKGESITFFLEKYIHFSSYGGEVICEEFLRMHPSSHDMMANFQKMQPKFLCLAQRRPLALKHDVSVMKCLMLISQNLPHDIPMKKDKDKTRTWAEEEDLMVILKAKDDVEGFAVDRVAQSADSVQPYLVLIQSDILDKKILKYFLVLDGRPMELSCLNTSSPHAFLQAFDLLMKTYVVFNVNHPVGWRNTLHFIQHFLCGVKEMWTSRGSRSLASPSQIELWNKLNKA